jgi:SAM-dependent methyltransferase
MDYDKRFFDRVDRGALQSAQIVVRGLLPHVRVGTLLDVGCGRGSWAATWQRMGCSDVVGVDGPDVDPTTLHIAASAFMVIDLVRPFDLSRRFDMVQCLEVAEHLPKDAADGLIDSLVRHGDVVLFSAAGPGQGGTHHVNEQPLEYWRQKFAVRGYVPFDMLRADMRTNRDVEPFYRYNIVLYANAMGQMRLSAEMRRSIVGPQAELTEHGSLAWRVRKVLLRPLPRAVVDRLARGVGLLSGAGFRDS